MKLYLWLFLFLICSYMVVSIEITEIMYNPEGSDTNREWLEIYAEDLVNLSGWTFYEANTHHGLNPINGSFAFQGYAVIVDDTQQFLQDYPGYNGTLFDSSWSSLSNSGETLALYNQTGVVDVVDYDSGWGGTSGYSLEKVVLGKNSSWTTSLQQNGTPGKKNSVFGSCDWGLDIVTKSNLIALQNQSAVIEWKVNLSEKTNQGNVSFLYWLEDSQGVIVKNPIEKFTNSSEEFGWYRKTIKNPGGYIIKAAIENVSCFDVNFENNVVSYPVVISGVADEKKLESSIKIEKGTSKEMSFGDILPVNLEIFRGDTRKYSVKVHVENSKGKKVSEVSTIHAKEKNSDYEFNIPVLLKDSCSYETGNYFIEASGLGITEREKIKLKQKECGEGVVEEGKLPSRFSFDFFEVPTLVTSREKIKAIIILQNDDLSHNYSLWSYVYRGNRCYSCVNGTVERNASLQNIFLNAHEKDSVLFELPLDDAMEEGEYKIKIKLHKDNQKTTKEITETIVVLENKKELLEESQQETLHVNSNGITGAVVYESTTTKAKNTGWIVVVVGFIVLCTVVFRKL